MRGRGGLELVSNPQRRVDWQSRLARWRTSGPSIRQFCSQEGVSQPSFFQCPKRLAGLPDNASLPVNIEHSATSSQQLASAVPDSNAQTARFLPVEIVGGNHAASQPLEIRLSPQPRDGMDMSIPADDALRTADTLELAEREESMYPGGVDRGLRKLSHSRPVWRLENGRAVLIAYRVYRGPRGQFGRISGALGRGEFGVEIVIAVTYQVFVVGLSFDKVCMLMKQVGA